MSALVWVAMALLVLVLAAMAMGKQRTTYTTFSGSQPPDTPELPGVPPTDEPPILPPGRSDQES